MIRGGPSILLAAFALSSCQAADKATGAPGTITVESGWARQTAPGQDGGGGFLIISNPGPDDDRLSGGSSPLAARVEIHSMTMEGSVMRMRPVTEGLIIAAGKTEELGPGGTHLMLVGLKRPLAVGQRVPLTLEFERAGKVATELQVMPITATGPVNG